LMRSFFVERNLDLGFRTENLLTAQVMLPAKQYKTSEQQLRFLRDLLPRLQNLPGVVAAAGALAFPPFGGIDTEFDVAGKTHSDTWKGDVVLCSPRFFEALRIRLAKGRLLSDVDAAGRRKVAVVNQTLAAKYFPGEDPLGKQIKLAGLERAPEPVANPWFEIVGIVSDSKNHGVRDAVAPEAYVPYSFSSYGGYALFIRTMGNPSALIKSMNREIWAMDRNLVPQNVNSMEDALDLAEFARPRFGLTLFAAFAGIGLVLVSVGVYSVISYSVSQQSHEIGIRIALGASAGDVRRLVILGGLRFILIGIGAGLLLGSVVIRLAASEFPSVPLYDPLTITAVVALLSVVGTAACYLPSRRATRVDPVISLRYE
jgi:putative ABC transport system permease protein